jgi:hypothetical protein
VVISCSPAQVGAPDAAAIAAACDQAAYARCNQIQECSSTRIAVAYGDLATCRQYLAESCKLTLTAQSTSATVARREACTVALQSQPCADVIYTQNLPPDCVTQPGGLPDGAICAVAAQCQSTWCRVLYGAACGTCGPPPKAGDDCRSSSECLTGMTCSSAKVCAPFANVGTSCGPSQPCNDGLTCTNSVCVAGASSLGAPCSSVGAGCDPYKGLSCNAATSTCQNIVLAPAGEACGTVANQNQICQAATCTHGTCVANAALGGACDLASGPSCRASARCVVTSDAGTRGTCQIAGATTCM